MDRFLPGSLSLFGAAVALTDKQRVAADWGFAISNCLRRGMAFHARCRACTILMGPGHTDAGIGPFCGTHTEGAAPRPIAPSATVTDSLDWIGRGG
jgi:hypothetical protein